MDYCEIMDNTREREIRADDRFNDAYAAAKSDILADVAQVWDLCSELNTAETITLSRGLANILADEPDELEGCLFIRSAFKRILDRQVRETVKHREAAWAVELG
jgi:hypothetical protein